jgi:hypothetical protein
VSECLPPALYTPPVKSRKSGAPEVVLLTRLREADAYGVDSRQTVIGQPHGDCPCFRNNPPGAFLIIRPSSQIGLIGPIISVSPYESPAGHLV